MCFANSQSMCVCFGQNALNFLSLYVCIYLSWTHCMGIYIHTQQVWPKDPIDVSKDHLSMLNLSKDQECWSKDHLSIRLPSKGSQWPRRTIYRGPSIEGSTFELIEGSNYPSMRYPSNQTCYIHKLTVWPSQTRRIVDLVKLTRLTWTSFITWLNTDKVQTQVHQQTPPWL